MRLSGMSGRYGLRRGTAARRRAGRPVAAALEPFPGGADDLSTLPVGTGEMFRTAPRSVPMATQPAHDVAERQPDSPTDLSRRSWWSVLKRTGKQFQEDNLSDRAAALTYYALLSIFPGLLVLVSVLDLSGRS